MKGIDLLAAQCKPAAPEGSGAPAAVTLSEEQCQQIAQTVIGMLQNGLPDQKKQEQGQDQGQEVPDELNEGGEEDGIEEGL